MTLKREGSTRVIHSGCKYYDDCFTCPFEDCLSGNRTLLIKKRASSLYFDGHRPDDIAEQLNRSKRTILRYLEGV